ncbi:MAG: SDR family oxidoreductase [Acidobacteria bacterium]|nr:SDR family oxidoreductase [Acidobacteriota bacterium]
MSLHLVAGAAGFIGSHLCDRLIEEGHSVVGVDNFITGSAENLRQLHDHPQFRFIQADVTHPGWDAGIAAEQFEYVWHLASLASPVDYLKYPLETLETGSTASRNLLEVARRNGASFLVTSTSEVYGDPLEHPQTEQYWGNVNSIGPRSCYDESKRFAEAITMAYHRVHGVRTAIARIFNTYGPRMALNDGRVVPAFVDQALRGEALTVFGDGSQTRSFCYVSDLVEGLIRLMHSGFHEPVNLGNPAEMTMLEFAQSIQAKTGTQSGLVFRPLPQDDPKRRRPDITRAKQVLGWEPQVVFDEGMALTIEYFSSLVPA